MPAGPKARRTRAALVDAAIALFAEQGYEKTSVAQIAEKAGVSLGTFYQYFRNRSEVLTAMVEAQLQSFETDTGRGWRVSDGVDALAQVLEIYVGAYERSIDITRVWEQVSQTEPEMIDLRRAAGRGINTAFAAEMLRASKAGEIRKLTEREATMTARALSAMTDRLCFELFIFDPPKPKPTTAEVAALLARLWAAALGLPAN